MTLVMLHAYATLPESSLSKVSSAGKPVDHLAAGGWNLGVGSVRELHQKGASRRGQEPLNTEAEQAASLKAVNEQRD
jgi:hypothetical protein